MLFSDAEIIDAIKTNSNKMDKSLEYIYDKMWPPARKFVVEKGGTVEDARELFQNAVIVFYESVKNQKYEHRAKISTYIFTVINNSWCNELKKRKRKTDFEYINTSISYDDIDNDSIEKSDKIKYFMELLEEKCQKILTLFYYDKISMKEIAIKMGYKNEQNARNKKAKCFKALSSLVKERCSDINDF